MRGFEAYEAAFYNMIAVSVGVVVVYLVAWGGACAILAHNKGRNSLGWFFLGFLFTLPALLLLGFLDKGPERKSA